MIKQTKQLKKYEDSGNKLIESLSLLHLAHNYEPLEVSLILINGKVRINKTKTLKNFEEASDDYDDSFGFRLKSKNNFKKKHLATEKPSYFG